MNPDRALLGAVLSGYPDLDRLAEIVSPGDFREPHDESVWSAALRAREAGNRIDPVSVKMALGTDVSALPSGPVYLVELAQQCPNVSSAPVYAREVADEAASRRLSSACLALEDLAKAGHSATDLAEHARTVIDRATAQVTTAPGITIGDILPDVLEIAEHGTTPALPTGWTDLDRIIDGLSPGRLMVVGARPGVGKSLMGTNLAVHTAHHHKHAVLLCSMEMGRNEVVQRMLAHFGGVNLTALMHGTVDAQQWDRIAKCSTDLLNMPITIDESPGQSLASIRSGLRNLKRRRDDVALVVVDYLQLMTVPDRRVKRHEALGEISRGLKLLAREFNTCVVAMAQVNRESMHRRDGRPTMADLRESGSIEADADQVVLLHQPTEEDPELEVLVEKNRAGPRGQCSLQLQGHYARLASISWTPTRSIA